MFFSTNLSRSVHAHSPLVHAAPAVRVSWRNHCTGRIEMAEPALSKEVSTRQQYPVEPVVFRGSNWEFHRVPTRIGQRMLIGQERECRQQQH